MFNPQRKSKLSDIYMQQRSFQMHLGKVKKILSTSPPKSKRYDDEDQQRYLQRLSMSKKEVQQRLTNNIRHENHRLFEKLVQTERRQISETHAFNPQTKKKFNSYFSTKKNTQRIQNDNYTMILRMVNQEAVIPSLKQMKKQFKNNRRLSKLCRKLPTIVKYEEQFKRKLSMGRMQNSKSSSRLTLHKKSEPELKDLQSNLIDNQKQKAAKE